MALSEKYKAYLTGGISLAAIVVILILVGEIVLPFIFAIFIAYLWNPLINNIQKKIKNRNLAITSFLVVFTGLFVGAVVLFGGHVVNDAKRFVGAVETFSIENREEIESIKTSVFTFVEGVYESETVQDQLSSLDTLSMEEKEQDVMSALGSAYSFFESSEGTSSTNAREPWSPFYMLIYTIMYTIFILYTYSYFEEKYTKYFSKRKVNKNFEGIWNDFKIVFMSYFRQRAKVVIINIFILILAFTLMDLPGAIIIGVLTGILSYASHFHYLSLPLVGIGCWVLSVEHESSFLLYFGVVLAVYILISILEETVYFNKVMKSVNGMNPAIMLLSFTLWIYVFGAFTGTIIALPLTQFILLYLDRLMLYSSNKRDAAELNE